MTGRQWDDDDSTAARTHAVSAGHVLGAIVTSLHDDIGFEHGDEIGRGILVENDHGVDALKRREDIRPVVLATHGAFGSLREPTHGRIAIHANNEMGAFRTRSAKYVDMSWMQEVEDAVREHDGTLLLATPLHGAVAREDLLTGSGHRNQKVPTARGSK